MTRVVIYTIHAHQPVVTFQADRHVDVGNDLIAFYRGEDADHDEEVAEFYGSEMIGWVYVEAPEPAQ